MHDVVKRTEVHAREGGGSEAEQPDDDQESASECCSSCNHNVSFFFVFVSGMDVVHSFNADRFVDQRGDDGCLHSFRPKKSAMAPDTRWTRLCATLGCMAIKPGATKPINPATTRSRPPNVAVFLTILLLSLFF